MPPAVRCKGITNAGKRCRSRPAPGSEWCRRHGTKSETETEELLGPNESALVRTLSTLGPESDGDAARYQLLRSLARAVDTAPTRAALWAEYREALNDLKRDMEDGDEGLEKAVEALRQAALRSSAPVGDQAN